MKRKSESFILGGEQAVENIGVGLRRQILGHGDHILMARVWFDEGAVGEVHSHPHSQVSYVESGVFDVQVGGEVKKLRAGDCFFIPPHVDHGAVCSEAGVLLDVFSPTREDFFATAGGTS